MQSEAVFIHKYPYMCECSCCYWYLLDVTFNVEWQVEEKLEALQDIESVTCGIGFVFPAQNLLEKCICSITCSCEEGWGWKRQKKIWVEDYKNKYPYHIFLLIAVSGFLLVLSAIWLRDLAAKKKVTPISWLHSLVARWLRGWPSTYC